MGGLILIHPLFVLFIMFYIDSLTDLYDIIYSDLVYKFFY